MEIVYLLDTMKKMSALPKEDFEATKRVTEEMKKFDGFFIQNAKNVKLMGI